MYLLIMSQNSAGIVVIRFPAYPKENDEAPLTALTVLEQEFTIRPNTEIRKLQTGGLLYIRKHLDQQLLKLAERSNFLLRFLVSAATSNGVKCV